MRRKRFGGVPPLVTVLVIIAAIIATSLVGWFMYSSTSASVRQPMIEVSRALILAEPSGSIRLEIRNIGPAIGSMNVARVNCTGGAWFSGSASVGALPQGGSSTVTVTLNSGSVSDGATCVITFEVTLSGVTGSYYLDEVVRVTRA